MKYKKAPLALCGLILLIGSVIFLMMGGFPSREDPPEPNPTSQQDPSAEPAGDTADSGLNNDDIPVPPSSDQVAKGLLPSQVVGRVFPKVDLGLLATRLPKEKFAVFERMRLEFPEVDWTEVEQTHQAFLTKRAQLPLNLNDQQREAHAAWLAEVEPVSRALIELRAKEHGLASGGMEGDRRFYIDGFRNGEPVYIVTTNVGAAITTGVNQVRWNPGNPAFDPALGSNTVNGSEFYVTIFDGGEIREHTEFQLPNAGGSRIVTKETGAYSDHMTHVAGTIAAWGYNASAQGMAPRSWIRALIQQNPSDYTTYGMATPGQQMAEVNPITGNPQLRSVVGNTSLGTTDPNTGYDSSSANYDTILRDYPYYMHFNSSGNSGDLGYASITGTWKVAKNMVAIGNISAATRDANGVFTGGATIAANSSRGPSYDGRIKPDFVAKGTGVTSSTGTTTYSSYSGTSMASPNAAGSVALLMDYVRLRMPVQYLRSSTYRALLTATADDLGNPGPDYTFGWGILNVHAAAKIVREQANNPLLSLIVEDSLASNQTWTENYASDGTKPIRVSIVWLDPASTNTDAASRASRLVNDLDIRLIGPGGVDYRPYVMPFVTGQGGTPAFDVSLYDASAVTGDNTTDPVELIHLAAPPAGSYTVSVTHKGALLNNLAQPFSMAVSGMTNTPPDLEISRSGSTIDPNGVNAVGGTSAGNGTQFSYTITNVGDDALELTTPVAISNPSNCSVTVVTQPNTTVARDQSTSLVLTVTPAASGTWSFGISVASNDPFQNPYAWTVTGIAGSAAKPLMVVTDTDGYLPAGGTRSLTGTVAGSASQMTSTIANLGNANLTLTTPITVTPVANCSISVVSQPASTVAASNNTNLALAITPTAPGAWSATVSIVSNHVDRSPYTWTISGTAIGYHTVTYLGNSPDSGAPPSDAGSPYLEGATVTVLGNTGAMVKNGFSFAGWNTAANGTGTTYMPGATFEMPGYAISLHAIWNTLPTVSAGPDQTVSITSGVGLGWSHAAWTGDADSGINSAKTYTAKHCFGDNNAGSVTVNGVSFVESFATSGTGWSVSGTVSNWNGNDDASVSGNSEKLAQEFIYNGNPRTVTFSGLTPGQSYEANFYSAGWEAGDRSQTFSATGTGITNAVINQDQYGNNNGIRISCVYTATATTQQFVITPTGTSIGTLHLYALSNHQVITTGATATLNGSASDADGDPLTTTWSLVSKNPSTAANPTFANASQANAIAIFTDAGTYVLRLSANDGYTTVNDEVIITVADNTPTYALTVTNGSGDGNYASGAQVTITADAPASGYRFVNWTSSGGGSFANANSSTTTFTMPASAVTVTANYALNTAPVVNAGADQTVALQSVAGPVQMILAATDPIQGFKSTVVGGNSTAGISGTDWPTAESPPKAIDGSVDTKYLNFGKVGSGFHITPAAGATTLTGVKIFTANDASGRDPLTISIEGSNSGDLNQGSSWTLIQDNINLGINTDPGRKAAGPLVAVTASASYTSYRIIVKSQRGADNSVQYSEMQLFGSTGVIGATANLNGSATDADGDSLTTTWSVVSKDPSTAANPTFGNAAQSVTTAAFTEAGTYVLRLSATDGYVTKTSDITIKVNPPLPAKYATWSGGTFANPFTDTALTSNPDGDSMNNLMEFAFGTDPTLSSEGTLAIDGSSNGSPTLIKSGGNFDYYFVRRKDHGTSGSVSYTAQFSNNLTSFTNSTETPVWVADCSSDPTRYEVVKVPFPNGTKFGRLEIVTVP